MRKNLLILLVTGTVVAVLDQATKLLVAGYLYRNQVIEVIPGLFNLVYYRNTGAAFGVLNNGGTLKVLFLISTSLIALGVITYLVRETKSFILTFALSLVAGGAVGNLIDRLLYGSVIDFLEFYVKGYYWPAFNVADSAITVGVFLAALHYLKAPQEKQ